MPTRSSIVRALALLALPAFTVALTTVPASAGISEGNPTLTGVVACEPSTGHQLVSWTLTNPTGTTLIISSAVVDGSGMTHQGPIDTTADMSPTSVTNGGTSSGTIAVTGDGTGDLHLVITYTLNLDDPTVDGEVVMPGGCEQTVATTAPATSTTAPAAEAAAVAATPAFTG